MLSAMKSAASSGMAMVKGAASKRGTSVSSRKSGRDSLASDMEELPEEGMASSVHMGTDNRITQLTVKVMDDLVTADILDKDWRTRRHTHLDFSDEKFALKTFRPMGFKWVGKELRDEGEEKKDKDKDKKKRSLGGPPQVQVFRVVYINLADNQLTDDDFRFAEKSLRCLTGAVFGELKTLHMERNFLRYPVILMPRLRELHISRNRIARFPPLAGLPKLEVINVSHNEIGTLQADMFVDIDKLQVVDVSYNKIDVKPSEFQKVVWKLVDAQELTNLQFKENPFCIYFSEYQMLTVQLITNLAFLRLDDLPIGKDVRLRKTLDDEANAYFGEPDLGDDEDGDEAEQQRKEQIKDDREKRLKNMDKEYARRKDAIRQSVAAQHAADNPDDAKDEGGAAARSNHPKITDFLRELDQAIANPADVVSSVALVFDLANQVSARGTAESKALFNIPGHKADKDEAASTFVQQVTMVADRHPETKILLFRALAKFCSVPYHKLGELCLSGLANLSMSSQESMEMVMEVIAEMVLPIIQDNTLQEESCAAVVLGLSKFNCPELADKLTSVMAKLCIAWNMEARGHSDDEQSDAQIRTKKALAKLILLAVQNPENSKSLLEMADSIVPSLVNENTGILSPVGFQHESECDMYMTMTEILQWCFKHNQKEITIQMQKMEAHTKLHKLLYDGLKKRRSAKEGGGQMRVAVAKKTAAALDILAQMLGGHESVKSRPGPCAEVAQDLLRDTEGLAQVKEQTWDIPKFYDVLLKFCTEEDADPVCVASAMACITLILRAEDIKKKGKPPWFQWNTCLTATFEVLALANAQNNKVLPMIDSKKFKGIYKRCEEHSSYSDEDRAAAKGGGSVQVPGLNGATNTTCHSVIIAVVNFLQFVSSNDDCQDTSDALNKQGREGLLFKLLEVPSEDVQEAVMGCLGGIDVEDLEDDEVVQLVGLLDPSVIASKESLLGQVMKFLQRILEAKNSGGEKFRAKYAEMVISKTFEVLLLNSERVTFGSKSEEMQKLELSQSAVSLLTSASEEELLRKYLRTDKMNDRFAQVIKCEERFNNPHLPDISLELTWAGRLLENLFKCLDTSNKDGLDSRKKQSFRIMSRMADILTGVSDSGETSHASAEERAHQESTMWKERNMKMSVMSLDDKAREELYTAQNYFATFNCLEQLFFFMEAPPVEEESDNAGRENTNSLTKAFTELVQDQPQIRVVQKQQEATDFWADVRSNQRFLHKKKMDEEQAAMDLEEEHMIELEVEKQERLLGGEELMSLVFMHLGWRHHVSDEWESRIDVKSFMMPMPPKMLRSQEKASLFLPEQTDHIYSTFQLVAILRSIYAMLVVPALERLREEIIMTLWETAMQVRLLILMDRCKNYMDCHVASKFMRLMSIVLKKKAAESRVTDDRQLVGIFLMADFAGGCLEKMSPLLASLGNSGKLSRQQETLCSEAVRLLTVLLVDVTRVYMKVPVPKEIQQESTAKVCVALLPMLTMRGVFLALLYDMQVSMGSSHGMFINEQYVKDSFRRQELQETCAEVLSTMLAFAPTLRYQVLELFNAYSVHGKVKLHTSTVSNLMDRVQIHKLALKLETSELLRAGAKDEDVLSFRLEGGGPSAGVWEIIPGRAHHGFPVYRCNTRKKFMAYHAESSVGMSASAWHIAPQQEMAAVLSGELKDFGTHNGVPEASTNGPVPIERTHWETYNIRGAIRGAQECVLRCMYVQLVQDTKSWGTSTNAGRRMLVVTNRRLLLLTMELHAGFLSTKPCGVCPPESFCPIEPAIEREHDYYDLTRVVVGPDAQMLILGWMVRKEEGWGAATDTLSRLNQDVEGETFECMICEASTERQHLLELLQKLSAPRLEHQIGPTMDTLIKMAMQSKTASRVLCMHYGFRKTSREERLSFFLLTEAEICEFKLCFDEWKMPYLADAYLGEEQIDEDDPVDAQAALAPRSQDEVTGIHRRMEQMDAMAVVSKGRQDGGDGENANTHRVGGRALDLEVDFPRLVTEREKAQYKSVTKVYGDAKQGGDFKMNQAAEAARKVLHQWFKRSLFHIEAVEFPGGGKPVLKVRFIAKIDMPAEEMEIRFLDTNGLEAWRRCLSLALHKQADTATQWQRKWKESAGAGSAWALQ